MTLLSDIQALQGAVQKLTSVVEKQKSVTEKHEEQINGSRGISAAIQQLGEDIKQTQEVLEGDIRGLRRAAYWVAGLIVAGSITFAFSVLKLVGGG